MNKMKLAIVSLLAVIGVIVTVPVYAGASAADQVQSGVNQVGGNDPGNNVSLATRIQSVVNVLLYVLGAIAVIMIIIGGIRYVVSGGDASGTKAAKDTILYAAVGLVIAILAYAIVNFVITAFTSPPPAP